jgi:membrane protease YdiL (CAAX protease family)
MLARLGRWCLGLVKRTLQYYVDRIKEAAKYLMFLVGAAAINALIMIPLGILVTVVMTWMGYNMSLPHDNALREVANTVPMLAVLCLSIGIFEETYFRYLVQDCLLDRWLRMPRWFCLVLASVVFGMAHLYNPGGWVVRVPQAIAATGAGFWFGYVYRKRGLHFAILTHALYDFAIMAMSLL